MGMISMGSDGPLFGRYAATTRKEIAKQQKMSDDLYYRVQDASLLSLMNKWYWE